MRLGEKAGTPAKITPPHVSRAVRRQRLFRILDQARLKRLIWVSGPAGSGKTTLVASYIRDRRIPAIWYQAGPRDADVALLFQYTCLAVKQISPGLEKSLPLFTNECLSAISAFARQYFERLFQALPPGSTIVIDDYQEVPNGSAFHEAMIQGLETVPENNRVFVLSRQDVPLTLAKWKAVDSSSFLLWNELRFTFEEMKAFLSSRFPQTRWKRSRLQELYEKTDGWISGLILLLQDSHPAPPGEIGKSGPRLLSPPSAGISLEQTDALFDYFMGVVFENMAPSVRLFLLKTCFLPSMTAAMAQKMTRMRNAEGLLHSFSRNNYFTTEHPGNPPQYRYHPLFREFLENQAQKRFKPGQISRILKAAVPLLKQENWDDEVASLYSKLRDWPSLSALILDKAPRLYSDGNVETLDRWISSLPAALWNQDARFLYWKGICRVATRPAEGQAFVCRAFETFRQNGDLEGALMACSTHMELEALILQRDFRALDPYFKWLDDIRPGQLAKTHPEWIRRIAGTVLLALSFRNPCHRKIRFWREQAEAAISRASTNAEKISGYRHLLFHHVIFGNTDRMKILQKELESYGTPQHVPVHQIILGLIIKALTILYTEVESESGLSLLQRALDLSYATPGRPYEYWILNFSATASLISGNAKKTGYFLSQMDLLRESMSDLRLAGFHVLCARKAVLQRDPDGAHSHFEAALGHTRHLGYPLLTAISHFGCALAYVDLKDFKEARKHLTLAKANGTTTMPLSGFMLATTEAYASFRQGKIDAGVGHLRKAFALGRKHSIMMTPCWSPFVMAELCARAFEHGINRSYAEEIVRKHRLAPPASSEQIEEWPWDVRIHTLGKFEIYVHGQRLEFSGKVQKKPLELLKAIIAFGGDDVLDTKLMDALWPDSDGASAHKALEVTLLRLRRMLGADSIQTVAGHLTLKRACCWIDLMALRSLLKHASSLPRKPRSLMLAAQVADLYQGPFLPADGDSSWAAFAREDAARTALSLLATVGNDCELAGEWKQAADAYRKGLEIDKLSEDFYQRLMVCYKSMGLKAEAARIYNDCRANLERFLRISPSRKTRLLYESLRQ